MNVIIDYRRMLMNTVCKDCAYYGMCGMSKEYDCAAFSKLVNICENVDLCNPND